MSRREFSFVKGNSRQFWNIELSGNAVTVHSGHDDGAPETPSPPRFLSADRAGSDTDHDSPPVPRRPRLSHGAHAARDVSHAPLTPPAPAVSGP